MRLPGSAFSLVARGGLRTAAVLATSAALVGAAVGLSADASNGPSVPRLDHVFVIMMENTSYSDLLNPANPNTTFIQGLAENNGLATNYYGVTHPSLPNYVAAVSGSNWGSNSDDVKQADDGYFNHVSLTDELNAARISWKGYMESMPSAGYAGDFGACTTSTGASDPTCTAGGDTGSALYVRKHNPFMLFPDVFTDPQQAANVVPLTQLTNDLNSRHSPQFVWISPNICNDMHGGAPQCPYADSPTDANQAALYKDGDTFLKTWVTAIMHSRAWTPHSAIFVTWDEGGYDDSAPFGPTDNSGCCDSPVLPATPADPATAGGGDLVGGTLYGGGHVPMIVITQGRGGGITDATPTNHYSLLQTIELSWRLPLLGNASDTAQVQSLAPLLHSGRGHDR
ncbi:MAG TPA: alkaline phosphatase family protein [Solirubrobacteraceae bacterium]|nr:alkaline phosphatase family protein [Solirubrobacteraceae bacterium]